MTTKIDLVRVGEILAKYEGRRGILIQALLDIQSEFNWVPLEAMDRIRKKFNIPISQIYRVATFYKVLNLTPRGQHLVRVCLGTACHVRGGSKIMDRAKEFLGIESGETTKDLKFTLESVNCLGCCALGPVITVDNDYHGKVTPAKVEGLLKSYE